MMRFVEYLTESATEEKLKHLEHPEDHFLNAGEAGYDHAIDTLHKFHKTMRGEKGGLDKLTVKIDGAPSIVAGRCPETGKFFVGSKSVFNKKPKFNYTNADIDANHGHSPGLAQKLKLALKHLPKVIHSGVHQGDYLHDKDMRETDSDHTHFTANLIKHSVPKKSEEAKKIRSSKIGVAFHTSYTGPLDNLKAKHGATGNFSSHPDVHILPVDHDASTAKYTPERERRFKIAIQAAQKLHKTNFYPHISAHGPTMKQYVNHTVRTGEKRTASGYVDFLKSKPAFAKTGLPQHAEENKQHFDNAFTMHHHIENAKNILLSCLSRKHGDHSFSINNIPSKPEGYVAVTKGRPTKIVDRSEFSKLNFAHGTFQKAKLNESWYFTEDEE